MTASAAEPYPEDSQLAPIEEAALELGRLAGERITEALEREIVVEYKDEQTTSGGAPTNPVSETDRAVEVLLRERIAERFPEHGVIGEEAGGDAEADREFVWVLDPVDGTANFVNGFPFFACSIGVLHRGRPVVGAIWCSTSHALRAGVYHAREGGPLRFEGETAPLGRPSTGVSRRLGAAPGGSPGRQRRLDTRVTGSAALECAFVAAGIFQSARFGSPSIWDVAAGVCLVRSSGRVALSRHPDGWDALERFVPPASVPDGRTPTIRDWRQPLMLGVEEEAESLVRTFGSLGSRWRRTRWRLRRRLRRWL